LDGKEIVYLLSVWRYNPCSSTELVSRWPVSGFCTCYEWRWSYSTNCGAWGMASG